MAFGRIRFQFSLRTLLGLVTCIAFACAYLAVKRENAKSVRRIVTSVPPLAEYQHVIFRHEIDTDFDYKCPITRFIGGPEPSRPGPKWLRDIIGDDAWTEVIGFDLIGMPSWSVVHTLPKARGIEFLKVVCADNSEADLSEIARFSELRALVIPCAYLTPSQVSYLRSLPDLQYLDIRWGRADDDVANELARLKPLKHLYISNTQITERGIEKIRKALPDCDLTEPNLNDPKKVLFNLYFFAFPI